MSCSESVNKVVEIYVESMKESSADKVVSISKCKSCGPSSCFRCSTRTGRG